MIKIKVAEKDNQDRRGGRWWSLLLKYKRQCEDDQEDGKRLDQKSGTFNFLLVPRFFLETQYTKTADAH